MLDRIPKVERFLFELSIMFEKLPMELSGSAGSATMEGDTSMGSQSSQEDSALKSAPGQTLQSDINRGIEEARELQNPVTQFVNLQRWFEVKRQDDALIKYVQNELQNENIDCDKFMVIGHDYIGDNLQNRRGTAAIQARFANFPGYYDRNRTNITFQYAGILSHKTPPALKFQTEVKILRDWYGPPSLGQQDDGGYRTIDINYAGVGPSAEVGTVLDRAGPDFHESIFAAMHRRFGQQFSGAACSDISTEIRHIYGGDGLSPLLNDLGALSLDEMEKLDAKETEHVTQKVKRLNFYNLEGRVPGVSKNFMAAAALRFYPGKCTIKPPADSKLPVGSHVPLPLCSEPSEKIAPVLREKPMPCSNREFDVAPSNCRFNLNLVIGKRLGTSQEQGIRIFSKKRVKFAGCMYPHDLEQIPEHQRDFFQQFAKSFPRDGDGFYTFPDVFEKPTCHTMEEAKEAVDIIVDGLFQSIAQRTQGHVPMSYGFPDYKKKLVEEQWKVEPNPDKSHEDATSFTLPTRREVKAWNSYHGAWIQYDKTVKASTSVNDQHTAQTPKKLREGENAHELRSQYYLAVAENGSGGETPTGMVLAREYLLSTIKREQSNNTTVFVLHAVRKDLITIMTKILKHHCIEFSTEGASFMACQIVGDVESTIPGFAGEVTLDSVHPAWGGKFGLSRFDVRSGKSFAKRLEFVYQGAKNARNKLCTSDLLTNLIELVLQGYVPIEEPVTVYDEAVHFINLRTGEPYNYKGTEHEGCKGGTGIAQAHTTRTVSRQRVQTKLCTHPVPGSDDQRAFLKPSEPFFDAILASVDALDENSIVGDYPSQMHYYRPCWYGNNAPAFAASWYTWANLEPFSKTFF
ncbi:expressed unknown protein [Seminavis robusta]|uniref:Uncharacterized protein n=1 Tax=Seminavis robusta TaxID=568900 RepID=A0A9N8EKG0_9STRA|nr:expressed unknown protein [Seminavis robusta]|eukprot:Sro1410_g270340.1 n/a (857) ;mRNA; f:26904-29474